MIAYPCDLTIVQNDDLICIHDGGCTLRYEEYGRVIRLLLDGFPECGICCIVKSGRTVIKDQDFRLLHKRTCNRQSLFLPTGQILTALVQHKLDTALFLLYKILRLCD